MDVDEEEGAKMFFKIVLKFWRSWGVDKNFQNHNRYVCFNKIMLNFKNRAGFFTKCVQSYSKLKQSKKSKQSKAKQEIKAKQRKQTKQVKQVRQTK